MKSLQVLLLGLAALTLAACPDRSRGDKPVLGAEQIYLDARDQVLPVGVVGKPYEASLVVSGGEGPYTWYDPDFGMPLGLGLQPDGRITGTPAAAGTYVIHLLVTDSAGRASRILATLQIVLEPVPVSCGGHLEGYFPGSGHDLGGPVLMDPSNLEWIGIEMPDDLTTRIELAFTMQGISTLYVQRPAEVVGSANLADEYVPFYLNPGYSDMTVALDAGSNPSLTGYLTEPILPVLLVSQTPGNWSLDVICTDGPIFVTLEQYPVELGLPFEWDFDVFGSNEGVRIWTEDPLPDWMVWDESTGRVTGTAMEPGTWEITVIAETMDGRRREERAVLGVYEVFELGCDETTPLALEESYFDGDFYAFYDPRGFAVYRVPLQDELDLSSIELMVWDSDGHYLGLANPDPGWMNFYGGAERQYVSDVARLTVDPGSYPSMRHYLETDDQALYFSAGSIGTDFEMQVSVTCHRAPRPDLAALPVIQPLTPESFTLRAIGGTPPYHWEADGLPSGITLNAQGVLSGQSGAIGVHPVRLTVTDALGASTTEDHDLYIGNDAACAGYHLLSCGDSVDGTFTQPYYNNGNGVESTRVFCTVEADRALGYEIYSDDGELRVDVADPGRSADQMFGAALGTYVGWVERDSVGGIGIDSFSWPDLDDYESLPVLLSIRAYDPGSWTVHLACQ